MDHMNQWIEILILLLEQGANIAAIVGVIGIIVAVFTYRKSVHDTTHA